MLRYKIQIAMQHKKTNSELTPGEYVRETILKSKDMSVTDAAKILGIGRPAFSNFLNGNSSLSTDMAARIERAFGISAQKLHDLQAVFDTATTKGAPANTKAFVPPFLGITANDIEDWANHNIRARSRLSVFLRTLVNSTGVGLTKVDFPGNDDSERPGWDGVTIAFEGTPWIPEGQSGWEFGCNKEPKSKADGDYSKSIKLISKADRANIIFIFITPWRWPGKAQWVEKRITEGQWKDIRAYDAIDLEQWLEQSVAGQTWFANETKRIAAGTRSLDQCWADWSQVTSPPLPRGLFKVAVEVAKSTVESMLAKTPTEPIIIAADSTEEAVAFLSELFSETGESLFTFRDRVVVFDQPGVLPKLATGASNFIAVAATREVEREFAPFGHSIHTIVVYPRNAVTTEPHVLLEPLNYETFHAVLEESGYGRDEINRLDSESGRSLTVLRRRISNIPAVKTPVWADNQEIVVNLSPFMFAGAWNSINQCDQAILSFLANDSSYSELEKGFQGLTQLNDAPVWSAGTFRGVVSKMDLLFAISSSITRSELETYFQVADLVLSEDDPSLDLPEKSRPFASLYKKTREISGTLRKGICETLVLLSVHGNALFQKRLGVNVEDMAILLVRKLMGEPLTTRRLEAHDGDLPTYAEVAPEEFLIILEKDLKTPEPASLGLMKPFDSGIFSNSSRTGILWALEILAWSPTTLSRAVLVLAKLAEIKIEDNLFNKPIESLKSIFRSWVPQTAASVEKRIAVMELLMNRFPKIAWEICMDQFGELHQTGHYNQKPRWRNEGHGYGGPLTYAEIRTFVVRIIDMTLNWKGYNKSMLSDLIERLHSLDDSCQEMVWNIVKNWADTAGDFDKAQVREKIRTRFMPQREMARKTDKVEAAANAAYESLEPTDILNKYEWLFRDTWIDESFDEIYSNTDHRKREERITKIRVEALRKIIAERGIEGIVTLAEMGKAATIIGALMITAVLDNEEIVDFIFMVSKPGNKSDSWTYKNILRGAIQSIENEHARVEVLKQLRKSLSPESFVKLLQQAPFRASTWTLVEEMEDLYQQTYWTSVQPIWQRQNDNELNKIVDKLLATGRPRAAFNCVNLDFESLRPAVLFRLLEVVALVADEPEEYFQLRPFYVEKAFEILDKSATFSVEQMAGLEFVYLDVLSRYNRRSGGDRGIPNLEKYVDQNPDFFAQAVAWVYKRKDGGTDPEELQLSNPLQIQNRAEQSHKLIKGLQRLPGRNKQGEIDFNQLLGWVNTVRKICAELGRLEAGDLSLGKLLAEAPRGVDDVWPCEPVREVLERIQSEKISSGIMVGLFNSRGAHWRGEGGDQERALAAMYKKWGAALEFSHPFVASSILKRMADSYERDAQHEDNEAVIRRRLG